jgi:hypothetical protein
MEKTMCVKVDSSIHQSIKIEAVKRNLGFLKMVGLILEQWVKENVK